MPSTSMGHADTGEMDEGETDVDTGQRMHTLRLMLLEKLLQYMPELRDVGGVRAIPFMQVGYLLLFLCQYSSFQFLSSSLSCLVSHSALP